jgi:RNA polymerase sigma-70 factor (ECF subfamily)
MPPADGRGLSELLERHYGFVRSIVQHLAGPALDPEDLTQDVFLVAYQKVGALRAEASVRSWLYGICRRVVSNQRRKRQVREAILRWWSSDVDEAPASPEAQSEGRELERLLYEALDRLSPKKREAIILFALEGMEGEQIAELLGVPLGTVWTRLHAARRELSGAFETPGDLTQPAEARKA